MKVYDVFISYRRSDGAHIAYDIYKYFSAKGLRVFFDQEKMENGHYFDTQIVGNLVQTPNYILIATPDVFRFRNGEDWVKEEIKLALDQYEKAPENRTLNVIVPSGFEIPISLPGDISNLSKPNQIFLSDVMPSAEDKRNILNADTYVNRHNMWNAGHRWLENSKKRGSRFSNLMINEMLIPEAKRLEKKQEEFPIYTITEDNKMQGLLESIKETQGHLYLIGEGGIGKTTALIRIMKAAYDNQTYTARKQIPLFIELAGAPDIYGKYYENGKSTFIRRCIYQQIHMGIVNRQISQSIIAQIDDAFTMDPETVVYPINDLFTDRKGAPEFLLLLDGLNEISKNRNSGNKTDCGADDPSGNYMMLRECPNIRIILTSRAEEQFSGDVPIEILQLFGIEDHIIREYLQTKNFSQGRINSIFDNEALISRLRIPLFLILFFRIDNGYRTGYRREILNLYFNEKCENLDVYTVQKHLDVIEENAKKNSDEVVEYRVDAILQCFILDFLVPELAWNMVQKKRFYCDFEDIGEFLIDFLERIDTESVFGKYGRRLFRKYLNKSNVKKNTRYYAKKMLKIAGGDLENVAEIVLNCSVFAMAIMHEKNGQFGFVHHYIRDYFAAVKCINDLRMTIYLAENDVEDATHCNRALLDNIINDNILSFVGEILGEHRNIPKFKEKWEYQVPVKDCNRNLIERNLDICRGRFENHAYLVRNLVKALELVREDFAGINLSELDLTDCDLSYVNLGHMELRADLNGSKVMGATILSYGGENLPQDVTYSPDGRFIITLNSDGTIKCWNTITMKCEKVLNFGEPARNIAFSPDGKILVIDAAEEIVLWDWDSNKIINSFNSKHSREIMNFSYSNDGKMFSTVSHDGKVIVWDTIKHSKAYKEEIDAYTTVIHSIYFEVILTFTHKKMPSISCKSVAVVNPQGDQIAVSTDYAIVVWNLITRKHTDIRPVHVGERGAISYYPSGKEIAFGVGKYIEIWDVEHLKYKGTLEGHEEPINYIEFSKSGKYLVSLSYDTSVKLWDYKKRRCLRTWRHKRYGTKAIISPDEKRVVILWEIQPCFTVYDISSGSYVDGVWGTRNWSKYAKYLGDGSKFMVGGQDGSISVWDANSRICLRKYQHDYSQGCFACNQDGTLIFGVNKSYGGASESISSIRVWNDDTNQLAKEIVVGRGMLTWIHDIAYNSSKDQLAVAESHGYQIWDINSCSKLYEEKTKDYLYNIVEYSNDGNVLITLKEPTTLQIVDANTYKEAWEIQGSKYRRIHSVAFSRNGKYIAIGYDKIVEIWNIEAREYVCALQGHESTVNSIKFSPDDKFVATGSSDCAARIWDTNTGECVGILQKSTYNKYEEYYESQKLIFDNITNRVLKKGNSGHSKVINSVDYSPDGRYILTASNDGLVKIWDVDTLAVVDNIYMLAGRTGINIYGVNMCNLHPESQLSSKDIFMLKQYGVLMNNEEDVRY